MQAQVLSWFAVACIGIGNTYIGRLIAFSNVPKGIVGRRSRRAAVVFILTWLVGLSLLYLTNGFKLTLTQAIVLAISFGGSYAAYRAYVGTPVPPEQVLNPVVHAVARICERHSWDMTSKDAVFALALSDAIHFDGGDYDLLVQLCSNKEQRFRAQTRFGAHPLSKVELAKWNDADYDLACAREIASTSMALAGFQGHEGLVARESREFDMTRFDWNAYERLQWLAEAIRSQWGEASLWSK